MSRRDRHGSDDYDAQVPFFSSSRIHLQDLLLCNKLWHFALYQDMHKPKLQALLCSLLLFVCSNDKTNSKQLKRPRNFAWTTFLSSNPIDTRTPPCTSTLKATGTRSPNKTEQKGALGAKVPLKLGPRLVEGCTKQLEVEEEVKECTLRRGDQEGGKRRCRPLLQELRFRR